MATHNDERRPLLQSNGHASQQSTQHGEERTVEFGRKDKEDPHQWSLFWKYLQTFQVFMVAFALPMGGAIFAPAMTDIAGTFSCPKSTVLYGQTGFVVMLGIAPLFHAPMSESFGRRPIYMINLAVYTLLQIATALSPNVASFIAFRTLSGIFGSVGVANGGGTISDMFETRERAKVLGIYLIAPLIAPPIGPLIGGLIVGNLHWRMIFWFSTVLSGCVTIGCFFFLYETRAPTILQQRKASLEKQDPQTKWNVEGVSDQSIIGKIASNSTRAVRILVTQPIVLTMSLYQALIFSSMYTLYSQYSTIWSTLPYNFTKTQIGLAYLGPVTGFIFTSFFIVMFIDRLYDWLANRHENEGQPEYRLPMANVGAVLLPISLFWFGWAVEKDLSWPIPLAATLLFGASQVSIFNTVQTYYIDAYTANAASALAAGAFLRSVIGGTVPIFVGDMFDK